MVQCHVLLGCVTVACRVGLGEDCVPQNTRLGAATTQAVDNSAFYEALEVAKGASDVDIKKAYRRLALKVHFPADAVMYSFAQYKRRSSPSHSSPLCSTIPTNRREISRRSRRSQLPTRLLLGRCPRRRGMNSTLSSILLAQVLSDPAKRADYDAHGERPAGGSPHINPADLFASIFRQAGGGPVRSGPQKVTIFGTRIVPCPVTSLPSCMHPVPRVVIRRSRCLCILRTRTAAGLCATRSHAPSRARHAAGRALGLASVVGWRVDVREFVLSALASALAFCSPCR